MVRKPRNVLILCTGNSCRSQMAEALVNRRLAGRWHATSAGTEPAAEVHPLAIRAMAELDIDIASASPTRVDVMRKPVPDLVITVCDAAHESCPVFPGATETIHLPFRDPATAAGTEDERMAVFRSVRDAIADRLLPLLAARR